jgi:hypothetical protein
MNTGATGIMGLNQRRGLLPESCAPSAPPGWLTRRQATRTSAVETVDPESDSVEGSNGSAFIGECRLIGMKEHIDNFGQLVADFQSGDMSKPDRYDSSRRWSYGDVENNGVFYHPQLTNYAHQAFEEFFYAQRNIQYADLSGRDERHDKARRSHDPRILDRMTFPVAWLHQWMRKPMAAGDLFHIWIDTIDLTPHRIGVRAHIFNEQDKHAGFVIWVRSARLLDSKVAAPIPDWFPRR